MFDTIDPHSYETCFGTRANNFDTMVEPELRSIGRVLTRMLKKIEYPDLTANLTLGLLPCHA